jgi:spore coat protein U-like protein
MTRLRSALVVMALAGASPALADCTISASGPVFGTYEPSAPLPLDAAGTIQFSCTSPALVTISTGSSGTYAVRTMRSGDSTLGYNLYTHANRNQVWGDSTGGTAVRNVGVGSRQSVPIFGRIPPSQDVAAGEYSDTLMVTFNF